jgi:hypothetical protein
MLWFYEFFFPVVWIFFLLYWRIKAANTKTTQRLESAATRILRVFIFLIAIVLLSTTRIPLPWLYLQLWPVGFWPFWLGVAVTIAGLLFAVWAREHLGRNWSRSVTIKQGHKPHGGHARAGEVGLCRSTCEAAEQRRATFCGGCGGKGTDEGKHRSVAHAPDTEREAHVPGAGRCAKSSKRKETAAVHRFAPPSEHRPAP